MLVFILPAAGKGSSGLTASHIRQVLPGSHVHTVSSPMASYMNDIIAKSASSLFLTLTDGTILEPDFLRDMKRACTELHPEEEGWVTFASSEQPMQPAPVLWHRNCLQGGLVNGFPDLAHLPFETFVLADMQIQAGSLGWKGRTVYSPNWRIDKARIPRWRKPEKEIEYIQPIITRPQAIPRTATQPGISVVLCTYNDGRYVPWAIRSVLAQTLPAWELIIVNDGSTDHTAMQLIPFQRDPRIRILENRANLGKSRSLNLALKEARGDWILELDADDWLAPDCLETMLQAASVSDPRTALWHSHFHRWTERSTGEVTYKKVIVTGEQFHRDLLMDRAVPPIPRFYRKQALLQLKGWCLDDPSLGRLYEDLEIVMRISVSYYVTCIPKALYHQRMRLTSISQADKSLYELWKSWMNTRIKE
ncbi:glycosyltransferase family 2 protein [Paenibacillus gansuensis]|uniref:Glycosyltransferase family 2 protein n=1 Tax=Paenibacillus gansuensis TaxID=306542 RepID=A0ABW5PB15_9BACL